MKRILLTGFNPFGKIRVNPSQLLVEKLAMTTRPLPYQLITALLPTEYVRATRHMKQLLRKHSPDVVVCLGVAAGRREVCLERIALNLDDEQLADNAGLIRLDREIVKGGPALYRSTLPLQRMLASLRRAQIPARISNHAGTYLCNHIFYVVCHETRSRKIPAGFIHLPALKSGKKQGLALRTMLKGVLACLDSIAENV